MSVVVTMQRNLRIMTLVLMVAVVGLASVPSAVFANYRDGRPIGSTNGGCGTYSSKNYFSNTCGTAIIDANGDRGYVLPRVYSGGSYVPAMTGVTDKATLKQYIADNYASSDTRRSGPAAFLYQTLLGRSGDQANANGGKTVSAADRADVNNRIDNPAVTFSIVSNYDVTTNGGGSETDDVKFITRTGNPLRDVIILRHNGIDRYILEIECANPIGDLLGLPSVATWSIVGESAVSTATATPGQVVNFSHRLGNTGPDQATGVWWAVRDEAGAAVDSAGPISINVGWIDGISTETFTVPATSNAGDQFCRYIEYDPSSANPAIGTAASVKACVAVVYNYDLDPSVSGTAQINFGGTASFTYTVSKTGTRTNSTDIATYEVIIPSGTVLPAGFGDPRNDASCANYTYVAGVTCAAVNDGLSSPQIFTLNATTLGSSNISMGVRPAGTKVCRLLSVDSRDETGKPHNRFSNLSCTLITKSPYIAITNSDAAAGGGLSPSCSTVVSGFRGSPATSFGSFGEYGLVPTGTVSNFGSADYVGAIAKQLTFANTPTLGTYRAEHCIGDQIAHYQPREAAATPLSSASPIAVNSLNGDYRVSGDIILSGGTLSANQHALIYAPGTTVTITGDIKYNPIAYVSFRQVPQLIVVANRIVVNNNVRELAGSYFAAGTATSIFNTCSEAGDTPNSNQNAIKADGQCQNPVVVNGSVSTAKIVVPRTSGGTGPGLAAEIFRLRPEAFLTPYELGIDDSAIKTDILQERPARY